nr:uncharacterized protein LOC129386288 [Dermacentor andersoni]
MTIAIKYALLPLLHGDMVRPPLARSVYFLGHCTTGLRQDVLSLRSVGSLGHCHKGDCSALKESLVVSRQFSWHDWSRRMTQARSSYVRVLPWPAPKLEYSARAQYAGRTRPVLSGFVNVVSAA